MIRGREDLENLLAELEERLRKANIELTGCPEGRLVQGVRAGKRVYFQVVPADVGRDRRIAINKRPDIIKKLARKKYLETEIKILEKDIAVITQSIGRYVDPTTDNILKALPDRYRKLSERWFFRNEIYANINESRMYENSETEWIEYVIRWTMEPFEQSTFEPQLKNKTTARGIKVRTKSEVIVSEKLDVFMLPYRYEQMLYIENYSFSPDFTILTKRGLYYWEHAGKVNDPRYLKKHKWKMNMYERAGIVPWKNLIVTYDDEYGGIDTRIIEAEIRNKLL